MTTPTMIPSEPDRLSRRYPIAVLLIGAIVALGAVAIAIVVAVGFWLVPVSTDAPPLPEPVEATVPASPLSDGEMFVYLVEIGSGSITVDPAEMLTGRAAREAAIADGAEPGDFYLRNPDLEATTLPVADGVAVRVLSFDSGGSLVEVPIALSDLAMAFADDHPGDSIYGLVAGQFPVTIELVDGAVVAIQQVYLP